ncbi:MAG: electron transfer flavoprotein subunit beta/FixA family protein [Spirochaetales bacterium]|nr:electron transfer flavoprotein subunit beta/FixA family protein [Spirochaetales bacterium]
MSDSRMEQPLNLRLAVCIKQVPDTTNIRINPETNTLMREGVASIINPFDMYALEEALRLKERYGGTVTVISMGPPQAEAALRDALSFGPDKAVLLSDRAFAGADTLATSLTLSAALKKLGPFDVILAGKQAMDGDTGQVGPGIAENLGIPHVTEIRRIEAIAEDRRITVQRLLEDGYVRLRAALPVLLTVVKEINEPRLPSLRGKMNAKKAEIPRWTAEELGLKPEETGLNGSPTQVMKIFTPPKPEGGKLFKGEVKESVATLLSELTGAGILLGKGRGGAR